MPIMLPEPDDVKLVMVLELAVKVLEDPKVPIFNPVILPVVETFEMVLLDTEETPPKLEIFITVTAPDPNVQLLKVLDDMFLVG